MKHQFKPGEKEAVAQVLGINPKDLPDILDLGKDDEDEDEEDEDEDESESDDDEEDDSDDDEDEIEEEDEALEDEADALIEEYQAYRSTGGVLTFTEFVKNKK